MTFEWSREAVISYLKSDNPLRKALGWLEAWGFVKWQDLSGADLSGIDLSGAAFSCADLSGADLSRADLSRADLSRADLSNANYDDGINVAITNETTIWEKKTSCK